MGAIIGNEASYALYVQVGSFCYLDGGIENYIPRDFLAIGVVGYRGFGLAVLFGQYSRIAGITIGLYATGELMRTYAS